MITSSNCRMVMPPVYRFDILKHPRESKWGWHRASELLETVNNTLEMNGRKKLTSQEVDDLVSHINPSNFIGLVEQYSCVQGWNCIEGGRMIYLSGSGRGWLSRSVEHDRYVPAKLGMEVLKALKHPRLNRIKHTIHLAVR